MSYESKMMGSAGNAPVRRFRLCFLTPDLQSGSRITSLRNWLAGPKPAHPMRFGPSTCSALRRQPSPPLSGKAGSGSGSHTHLKKFMWLLSVHWSSFPQLKLARRAEARCFGGRNARLRSPSYGGAAFARRTAAGEGWWSRWVTLLHKLACRASALLVCHDPK